MNGVHPRAATRHGPSIVAARASRSPEVLGGFGRCTCELLSGRPAAHPSWPLLAFRSQKIIANLQLPDREQ